MCHICKLIDYVCMYMWWYRYLENGGNVYPLDVLQERSC